MLCFNHRMPRDRSDQHSADESCLVGAPPNAFQETVTSNLSQDWLQSQVNLSLAQRSEPNPDLANNSHQLRSPSNSAVPFNDFPTSISNPSSRNISRNISPATPNLPQDWLQSQNLSLAQRSEPNLLNYSHQLRSSSNSTLTLDDLLTSTSNPPTPSVELNASTFGFQNRFPANNRDFNNNIVGNNIIGNPSEDTTSSNMYNQLENHNFTENLMSNDFPESSLNLCVENPNSHELVARTSRNIAQNTSDWYNDISRPDNYRQSVPMTNESLNVDSTANMPTHHGSQNSNDNPTLSWNSNSFQSTVRFSNNPLFQRDIPASNTNVNHYSNDRSSINVDQNQLNNAMLLQNPSYDISQDFQLLGISNHDATSRNRTINNDSTHLRWNNDRRSVLPGTSIENSRQSSRHNFNERENQLYHPTQNQNYGNNIGNSMSFMSPPPLNRTGSHNNNNFSTVGNRVFSNQMYSPNACNVTHENYLRPAIHNSSKVISVPERRTSVDPEASAKHTHLEGPLISRKCVVDINTLLFICLQDKNGKPCYNHGGYTVSVGPDPDDSVRIAADVRYYKSPTTITCAVHVGINHAYNYKLSVMFGNEHVVGSPFQFNVVSGESLQIPYQFPKYTNNNDPIRAPQKVWGISNSGLGTILVAYRRSNDIYEYNYDLTLKRIINAGFNKPSKAIFIVNPTKDLGTIIVADKDNHRVVMIGYESKELIAEFLDCQHPWDLCSIGHNSRSVGYILVTHEKTISLLDTDLVQMFRIDSPHIQSPRGICRGYLNHVIVTDFDTNELVVLELKIHPKFTWEIVHRILLNQQKNPIPVEYLSSDTKKSSKSQDRLQGVTLDKGSGCILVCDSRRCSVKVVSYTLHHFTDLPLTDIKEIGAQVMGVIAIKDQIYVTTLSNSPRRLNISIVVKSNSIFSIRS